MQLRDASRSPRRTAPPAQRREQLIRATIRSIARHGLPDTTMATVAAEAGLSQGIINLHFKSKERLLLETLKFVVDEYRECWEKTLSRDFSSPAERLAAMVGVDFDPQLCKRDKLAVWFAFWGEIKSRPTYRKLCAERDKDYHEKVRLMCAEIAGDGGYDVDPDDVAFGLSAMGEGLWLDLLLSPKRISRDEARRLCMVYLAMSFPRHFGPPDDPKPLQTKSEIAAAAPKKQDKQ